MSYPTWNSREKATQDLVRIIQAHVGVADQQDWNSFYAQCGMKVVTLSDHFLPVSMTISSFPIIGFLQGLAMSLFLYICCSLSGLPHLFSNFSWWFWNAYNYHSRISVWPQYCFQSYSPKFFAFLTSWPNSVFLGLPIPPLWKRIWCKAFLLKELMA